MLDNGATKLYHLDLFDRGTGAGSRLAAVIEIVQGRVVQFDCDERACSQYSQGAENPPQDRVEELHTAAQERVSIYG